MSQANHSIMSYGTFGLWGALLAGGEVIVPESHKSEGTMVYIQKSGLSNFKFL